jgi:hypothetical protein
MALMGNACGATGGRQARVVAARAATMIKATAQMADLILALEKIELRADFIR